VTERTGRVRTDSERHALAVLAATWPVGTRVVHEAGRGGTVRLDNPAHVPGLHTGCPTAWCLTPGDSATGMVCVSWDNPHSLTWLHWVPAGTIRRARSTSANRPALATAGRRT
jgi:hypothetical protein